MARLIDADALKESLTETLHRCDEWIENAKDGETRTIAEANYTAFLESILRVKDAPTVDAVPRWIPCEERLPEPNVAVLGYAPAFDNIFAVYYDSVLGWMTWDPVHDNPFPSFQGEIVAWMPLPEPYKGERRDDELQEDNGRCEVPCAE